MDRIGSTHARIAGGNADGSTVIAEGSLAIIAEYDIVAVGRIDNVSASTTQDRVMAGMRVDRIGGTNTWGKCFNGSQVADVLGRHVGVLVTVEGSLTTVTNHDVVAGFGQDRILVGTCQDDVWSTTGGDVIFATDVRIG